MIAFALVFIGALIVALLIYAATKPNIFEVDREIVINAAPEKIFPHINNFHLWQAWTPYNKDPEMNREFSGPDEGVGARLAWQGNKKVGKGEISIIESVPSFKIAFDLHMIEPFPGRNHVEIHLKKIENQNYSESKTLSENKTLRESQTLVTWQLKDNHTYFLKIISTVMNLDKLIGSDFEVGLAKLKTVVENE